MESDIVADDKGSKEKNKLFFAGGLALCGLGMCAVGVSVGLFLTSNAAGPSPQPVNNSVVKPAVDREFSAVESEITQTDESESDDAVFGDVPVAHDVLQSDPPAMADESSSPDQMVLQKSGDRNAASDPLAMHIAMADEELRSGSYARAMRTYSFAVEQVSGLGRVSVLYRMALCSEASGNFHDASNKYQQIARSFSTTPWAAVARLGEARCLAAMGRIDALSAGVLRSILLDEAVFSPKVRSELLHVCGRGYCQAFMPDGMTHLLDDDGMIMPRWLTDPNRQLDLLPELLKSEPPPTQRAVFRILQQTDQLPDSIFLKTVTTISGVQSLLEAISTRCGFEFQISPSAQAAIAGRTQQVYASDISLSLLLDGLCAPFGLLWWNDGGQIHVAAAEEAEHAAIIAYRRGAGIRLLNAAIVTGPDSHQAGYSRVALGVLQFQHRSSMEAAYTFQSQMELEPRSAVEAEAAFNLGKCYLATGQIEQARQAFLKAVDSTSHNPNAGVGGYLYVGRLQIEEGQFQSAVSSMVRALALCQGTELEPHAALLLASGYLMAESPEGATSVLMQRRDIFNDHKGQSAAAFLSAMSRFRKSVLPGPRERAGRGLVTALTRFKPHQQFGSHWIFLHAQACEELGLIEQAIDGYTETIKRLPAAPLRDQAMIRLAGQYRFDDRLNEAAVLLAGVNADRNNSLGHQITMQAAMIALDQGDGMAAVKHCRHVVSVTDDKKLQKAALQVMGKGYELQRNHRAAIYCFAGMLPVDESIPESTIETSGELELNQSATSQRSERASKIQQVQFFRSSPVEFSNEQWRQP